MYDICLVFLIFYIYSILGWIVDCISCSYHEKKLVLNRGFLLGMYCPIYGYAALYIYYFLTKYYNDPLVLFIMAIVGSSIIEYLTSYIMEKIFNARWWDYSNRKFNIEGRICLSNTILFGFLGLLLIYVVNPFILNLLSFIPKQLLISISIILFVSMLCDFIITYIIMNKIKKGLKRINRDSTGEIDNKIKEFISNNFYIRKLFKSFPKATINLSKGDDIVKSINESIDNFYEVKEERKSKAKKIKKEIKESKK